jgi:hypothetical protein
MFFKFHRPGKIAYSYAVALKVAKKLYAPAVFCV